MFCLFNEEKKNRKPKKEKNQYLKKIAHLRTYQYTWKITVKKTIFFSKVAGRRLQRYFFKNFDKSLSCQCWETVISKNTFFSRTSPYSCFWILEKHFTGQLWMPILNVHSKQISRTLIINLLKWK